MSDLRRSISLGVTAVALIGASIFVVVSTAAADTSPHQMPVPVSLPMTVRVHQPIAHAALPLLMTKGSTGTPLVASKPSADKAVPAPDQHANDASAAAQQPAGDAAANGTPASQPGTPPALPASISLAASQTVCVQGQWALLVPSAQVTLQTPLDSDTPVTWYWEAASPDADATTPPMAPAQPGADAPAGTAALSLPVSASSDAPAPLLSTPESSIAYQVRLHVSVGTATVVSDWVSVPQSTGTCQS